MRNSLLICTLFVIIIGMALAPPPAQAVDQESINNAIGKTLFMPVRPLAMGGKYLSQFVTGVSKGDLKASVQATLMVVVGPVNLTAATAGDMVTLTKKGSPYGPPGNEAIRFDTLF